MKPLVIYHGNCADGFSAAWCFWRKYRDGADYVAGVYQKDPPDVTGRDVFLVDFSYKRAVVEQMLKAANSVCLIDHHKTAIEDLQPLFMQDSWTGEPKQLAHFTDLNRSGATLAWDYLFPGEDRPLLLGHVEDRDLWRFKLAGTREIQALVFSHEYTFETWDKLKQREQERVLERLRDGMEEVIKDAVKIIAANGRVTFRAEVESVQFKGPTDVKAQLKLVNSAATHALADVAGGFVTMVIEQIDELLAIPEGALAGEPDNRPLFDDSTDCEAKADAAASEVPA